MLDSQFIITGIVGSLLSLVVGFVVGRLWQSIKTKWDFHRINSIFPLANSKIALIFDDKTFNPYSGAGSVIEEKFVHVEALYAIRQLSKIFHRYKSEWSYQTPNEAVPDSDVIICIGGPINNRVTEMYLTNYLPVIFRNTTGELVSFDVLPNDSALFVRLTIKGVSSKEKTVVLLFGRNTITTECAIDFFRDQFHSISKSHLIHKDVALRLRCNAVNNIKDYSVEADISETVFQDRTDLTPHTS